MQVLGCVSAILNLDIVIGYKCFLYESFSPSTEIFLAFQNASINTFLRLSLQKLLSSNVLRMHTNGKWKPLCTLEMIINLTK